MEKEQIFTCLSKAAQEAGYATELKNDVQLNIAIDEDQYVFATPESTEGNLVSFGLFVCQINTKESDGDTINSINDINKEIVAKFHIAYAPNNEEAIMDMICRIEVVSVSEAYLSRRLPDVINALLGCKAYCDEHFKDKARC